MELGFSLTTLLPEAPPITIVHIGASMHPGVEEPYVPLVTAGRATVIGFEPHAGERAKLQVAYGAGYTFLPYFVGNGSAATYHETNWPYTGSLFAPNTPLLDRFHNLGEVTRPVAEHPVITHRLDEIPQIDAIDYLKVDAQGAELSIFEGAPRLLRDCLLIESEVEFVELYKAQPLFADVDRHLRGAGFQFHTLNRVYGRCFQPLLRHGNPTAVLKQMLWADAVYVTDFMDLERLSTPQLMKLAVLLHDIYGSADLALVILIALDRRNGAGPVLETAYMDRLPLARA